MSSTLLALIQHMLTLNASLATPDTNFDRSRWSLSGCEKVPDQSGLLDIFCHDFLNLAPIQLASPQALQLGLVFALASEAASENL
jgi:hypothetical protein